ncbi:uncharacterized protein L201_004169 [Kwoniella dendrophila CBS 6074]|uniref:BTB domain-containing protein n=1 Tax=Kwoniella dendrophila CBS 6074 TaxID=1295534 RepID=A0AAX4JVB6_9TREE
MPSQRNSEAGPSKKPRLHENHRDPSADVTLISNDNVELKASSFYLSRVSKFFEDAFNLPLPSSGTGKCRDPICLDFSQETISIFLDMVLIPKPYLKKYIEDIKSFEKLKNLLLLVEFILCDDNLITSILNAIKSIGEKEPMNLLKFAEERNDISMAQQAISSLYTVIPKHNEYVSDAASNARRTQTLKSLADKWEKIKLDFSKLSPEYQSELFIMTLLRCHTRNAPSRSSTSIGSNFNQDDWASIGNSFDPSKHMKSKIPQIKSDGHYIESPDFDFDIIPTGRRRHGRG